MELGRAALALVVLVLVAGSCGGDPDVESDATGATTTTRPPAFETPQGNASGTIRVDAPPAPGTYEFDQTGTTLVLDQGTEPEPIPPNGTLEVEPARQASGGLEQMQSRLDGTGDRVEQTLLYAADGIFLVGYETDVAVVGSRRSFVCKPDRPVRIFPNGVAPGNTWEDRVDCGNGQFHYRAVAEATEDLALGDGTVLPTLRVRVESTIDGEGLSTDSTYTLWLAPSLGIPAKTQDSTDAELSVYDVERRVTELLRSAGPR